MLESALNWYPNTDLFFSRQYNKSPSFKNKLLAAAILENFTSVAATEDVALSAPLGAPERKAFENLTSKEQKKISIAALNTEDSPGISGQNQNGLPQILGFRILCSGRLQISSFSKPAEKAESIELHEEFYPLIPFRQILTLLKHMQQMLTELVVLKFELIEVRYYGCFLARSVP